MPIYEFRCAHCGNIQEIIVTSSDAFEKVEMKCNACGGRTLERIPSRVSYAMGSGKGASPTITSKNCGSGNACSTIDLPGPGE